MRVEPGNDKVMKIQMVNDVIEESDIDKSNAKHYSPNDEIGSEDVRASAGNKIESLLTVQEISQLLKVPKSYVYWLTHQKKIPYMKIQGHLRFRQSHIDEWLRAHEVHDDVDIQEEVRDRN